MNLKWETLSFDNEESGAFVSIDRLKVFGGWILKSSSYATGFKKITESMAFIPDANHEWEIK